jgi:hypothetical protein
MGPLRFRAGENRGFQRLLISCDGGIFSVVMAALTPEADVCGPFPTWPLVHLRVTTAFGAGPCELERRDWAKV